MVSDKSTFATKASVNSSFMNEMLWGNSKQYDLIKHALPMTLARYDSGAPCDTTGGAGNPKLVFGGISSGSCYLQGQDAHGTTKTERVCWEFVMPPQYVNYQTIQVVVNCRYYDTGTGTMSVKNVDCKVYKQTAGGAGSDLCTTAAQAITTSFQEYTFAVTETNIGTGDVLRVFIEIVLTESGGTGAQKAEIGDLALKLDIKL